MYLTYIFPSARAISSVEGSPWWSHDFTLDALLDCIVPYGLQPSILNMWNYITYLEIILSANDFFKWPSPSHNNWLTRISFF